MNEDEINQKRIRVSAAKELGKVSYDMALSREKIIDDKLGKIMTFVSILIALVSFLYKELKIYGNHKIEFYLIGEFNIEGKYIFAIVMLMLLSVILLALIGQHGFKKSYIKNGEDLLNFMNSLPEQYNSEYNVDRMLINQYSNSHRSLVKTMKIKSGILFSSQLIIGLTIIIMIFTIIPELLK
ncbi:Phage protein [Lactococcus lactis subsp. lactis KF147]|nr:Phage protein [Lactococcus lactis subsp. lactis KF147]